MHCLVYRIKHKYILRMLIKSSQFVRNIRQFFLMCQWSSSKLCSSPRDSVESFLDVVLVQIHESIHASLFVFALLALGLLGAKQGSLVRAGDGA